MARHIEHLKDLIQRGEGYEENAEKLHKISSTISSQYEDLVSRSATYCFKEAEEALEADKEAAMQALQAGLKAENADEQLRNMQQSLKRTDKGVKKLVEGGMSMDWTQ